MNSDFDLDILQEELNSMETIDMSDFGFDLDIEIDDAANIFEEKEEEQEKNEIDPASTIYIGAVSLFGETGDTICCFDISKELSEKLLEVVKQNSEEYINEKILEALNGL